MPQPVQEPTPNQRLAEMLSQLDYAAYQWVSSERLVMAHPLHDENLPGALQHAQQAQHNYLVSRDALRLAIEGGEFR